METDALYDLLEKKRRELALTHAELGERAFGKRTDTSLQNIRRGAVPSFERLNALARALDLELYIGEVRGKVSDEQIADDQYVKVLRYDAQLSAGSGISNSETIETSALAFRKDWFDRKGLDAKHCIIVSVAGDSMEPNLYDGDLVMLDRRRTELGLPGIYGLVTGDGEARLKRIHIHDYNMILQSDNTRYPAEFIHADDMNRVTILGRVVWSGHDHLR